MCGIGGYLGDPARPRPLRPQALLLDHRGPDDQGTVRFAAADGTPGLFAFTRLSILDLSPLGAQPMSSEEGACTLVYNGEVYNHAALRAELVAAGELFRSRSDTEVVLRAYRAWGAPALSRLRGMFALALWDAYRQELVLARDELGIKPLYYCFTDGRLAFASEVRALLAAGAAAPRLDPRAVHGLLSTGAILEPLTILRDVVALPPGHLLRVPVVRGRLAAPILERIGPSPRLPHFLLAADGAAASASASAERSLCSSGRRSSAQLAAKAQQLAPHLRDTVAAHLVADVPVALLLSGGVDSTAVAALARAAAPAAQLGSFTLSYGDDDPHSEGAAARATAAALGLVHHDCHLSADAALAALPRFLAAQDQPSIDGFNTYLICQQVRAAGYKVALSGLGGDELFLGYKLHHGFAAAWLLGDLVPGPAAELAAAVAGLAQALSGPGSPPAGDAAPGSAVAARLAKAGSVLAAAALPPAARAVALYSRLRALWSPAEVAALLAPELGGAAGREAAAFPSGDYRAALLAAALGTGGPAQTGGAPEGPATVLDAAATELQAALQALGLGPGRLGAGAAAGGAGGHPAAASASLRGLTCRSLQGRLSLSYHLVMQLERQSYLRNTLLRDADTLSMAHGVELRVPLCDADLWQRVSDLGPEPALRSKKLLVAAVNHPLVTAAARQRKRGFTLPLPRFLQGALRPTVSACFADPELVRRAGLTAAAAQAWSHYLAHPSERMTYRLWSLFTLLAYVQRHGLSL